MLSLLVGLLIRSALVLIFADLLRRLPRRTRPDYRYKVLLAGFVLLLLWPLFPLFVPEVYIPLSWGSSMQGLVTVQQTIRTSPHAGTVPSTSFSVFMIWVLAILVALSWLVAGHIRVWLLKRQGVPLEDAFSDLVLDLRQRSGLKKTPLIVIVPDDVMPQTFGICRPSILLPPDFVSWSEAKQMAVLLHELAHIRRRDTLWQLLVNVVTAIWWFQPLCWISRRWVREESEQACDAAVLACGMQPSAYASELLSIAKSFRLRRFHPSSALPMASSRSLEARLQSILRSSAQDGDRSVGSAIATLFALTMACSAASVITDGQLISKGGVSMRRTLFSGLLTSASLSAAAIGGSVLDPSGAAVLNAKASLYNPDTKARQETVSMANGKFGFDHLPAGQYILRVDKEGFAPILREFAVQQNSTVDRGLKLQSSSSGDASVAMNDSAPAEGKPIRIGGEQQQTKLITKVQPVYPMASKRAGLQGVVLLEAVISADGMPKDVQVISSPSDDLSQSALEAVRQWRYSSTLLNGNPVDVVTEIKVNYTLMP